jgi:PAS domain S-box-containing protein
MDDQIHPAADGFPGLASSGKPDGLVDAASSLASDFRFRQIVDGIPALIAVMTAAGEVEYLSPQVVEYFGKTLDELKGWANTDAVHPADLAGVVAAWRRSVESGQAYDVELRLRQADGGYRWFHARGLPVRDPEGRIVRWYVVHTDISERKRAEAPLAGERRLLEMIARGTSLQETLGELCRTVERILDDSRVSVLLLDSKGERLRDGVGPSLPEAFMRQLEGAPVDPTFGPCSAAAYTGEQVIVPDLASAVYWPTLRPLAVEYGLRGCWSTPIKSSAGLVLGTFAIYTGVPSVPSAQHQRELERFTHLASIAIERDRVTGALKQSEQRYALAMEASEEGHWDWIVPADRFYVSPLLLQICGLPRNSIIASWKEFRERFPLHPDDRIRWNSTLERHFAGADARLETEVRILRSGETRWLHLTGLCLHDEAGALTRCVGSATDVTERKRIEEELRSRQELLDLAQKAARALAFEWRSGEQKTHWSPDQEAMLGVPPGTVRSYENWKKVVHPDDWPSVAAALERAQQQPGELAFEYRVVHQGGAIRWLQAKGRMFFDSEGKPSRLVGFMLDVTERRIAEEELAKMEGQLRQAQRLEAMGTLAGGIAHDFNNLLGAILGYGEMAASEAPAGSRLRRDIENIIVAGERGRALVDRILVFSRSEGGERVPVSIQSTVRETLKLVAAKPPDRVRIEHRLRAAHSTVMGDPSQIHQVVMNLMTNALHAMPSGGTLRVSLDPVTIGTPRAATVGSIAAADYVVLKVRDSGTGISPKILERIFDPFFTTKEVGVGTGLGLSLVHGIVTGLGGAIDVASTVGTGSVFTVYFPHPGELVGTGKAKVRSSAKVSRGNGERILVVDDEAPLVNLLLETLTDLGYTPVGFGSGSAALDVFVTNPRRFDAVVTDESMPGMSGTELIREIRRIRPGIPTMLVSGYVSDTVAQLARDAGADEMLRKPLANGELATTLARMMRRANREREGPAR